MTATETKPEQDSASLKDAHNYYGGQGGRAEVHDRTGLLVAILALFVAGIVLGFVWVSRESGRDEDARIRDQIIKLETEVKDLQIQMDEFKKR